MMDNLSKRLHIHFYIFFALLLSYYDAKSLKDFCFLRIFCRPLSAPLLREKHLPTKLLKKYEVRAEVILATKSIKGRPQILIHSISLVNPPIIKADTPANPNGPVLRLKAFYANRFYTSPWPEPYFGLSAKITRQKIEDNMSQP